ncbi:hypothetical protein JCM8547_003839 [Rhodosporidiobolus lusitaniae]
MSSSSHSLFFYGTLCHAGVLSRVIGNHGEHLTTRDAVLLDHARLHVEGEDYPAVVSAEEGEQVLKRPLEDDEGKVRGVLVESLTDEDVRLLDEFEGDEYTRLPCSVIPLSTSTPRAPLSATVYRWTAPISRLSPSVWTFEAFMRDSAHRWVGVGANDNPGFAEVDRRRAMGGVITPRGVKEEAEKVEQELREGRLDKELAKNVDDVQFGKKFREKYWRFKEGWVNINHGSYGAAPVPVVHRFLSLRKRIDEASDIFMKVEYEEELIELRSRLAHFIGCDTDDVVMVQNTTMGVNVVLRNLTTHWQKGDRLLYISTSIYNACAASLQYIIDTHPHLELSLLPVSIAYPISHDDLVSAVRAAIEQAENDGTGRKVRLALVDAVSSLPGVVVPWEKLVELFREKEVFSLVDAAHQIGQLPVSLHVSRPDAWASNCHKWLMAHRAVAVLYVDKRWQYLMHSIPTGYAYSLRTPENGSSWHKEFVWSATIDWSPVLSTSAALNFRRDVCGGEEKIYEYCHRCAVEGGELVAQILGTSVMRNKEGDGELIGTMVNIKLPLPPPSSFAPEQHALLLQKWWARHLTAQHNFNVPIFSHGDRYYTRLSAQVYLDLDDFRYVGNALKEVCEKVKSGEALREVQDQSQEAVKATKATKGQVA